MNLDKAKIIKTITKQEDKIFISNIFDRYLKYQNTGIFPSSNFINEQEELLIKSYFPDIKIYKINDLCSKGIIECSNDYLDILKITPVKNITHRDVLGALFSLGLESNMIGDIFIEEDCIYIISLRKLTNYIKDNLKNIKNIPVKISVTDNLIFTKEHFEKKILVVSSMRIDTIVSSLVNVSRKDSVDLIESDFVLVNYQKIKKTKEIKKNDIVSIRKYGKFKIGDIIMITKKNKKVVEVYKYV